MSGTRKFFRKVKFGDGLTVTDEGQNVIRVDGGGLPSSDVDDVPADAGEVIVADGEGGTTWAFPTVKVDGTRYDEILAGANLTSTDNTDGTVTLDATSGTSTGTSQHILLTDGHATPFTFNDLLQMDDGSDFMWSDPE